METKKIFSEARLLYKEGLPEGGAVEHPPLSPEKQEVVNLAKNIYETALRKSPFHQEREQKYGIKLDEPDFVKIAEILFGDKNKMQTFLNEEANKYKSVHKENYSFLKLNIKEIRKAYQAKKEDAVLKLLAVLLDFKEVAKTGDKEYKKQVIQKKAKWQRRQSETIEGLTTERRGKKEKVSEKQRGRDIEVLQKALDKLIKNPKYANLKGLLKEPRFLIKIREDIFKKMYGKDNYYESGNLMLSPIEIIEEDDLVAILAEYFDAQKKGEIKPELPDDLTEYQKAVNIFNEEFKTAFETVINEGTPIKKISNIKYGVGGFDFTLSHPDDKKIYYASVEIFSKNKDELVLRIKINGPQGEKSIKAKIKLYGTTRIDYDIDGRRYEVHPSPKKEPAYSRMGIQRELIGIMTDILAQKEKEKIELTEDQKKIQESLRKAKETGDESINFEGGIKLKLYFDGTNFSYEIQKQDTDEVLIEEESLSSFGNNPDSLTLIQKIELGLSAAKRMLKQKAEKKETEELMEKKKVTIELTNSLEGTALLKKLTGKLEDIATDLSMEYVPGAAITLNPKREILIKYKGRQIFLDITLISKSEYNIGMVEKINEKENIHRGIQSGDLENIGEIIAKKVLIWAGLLSETKKGGSGDEIPELQKKPAQKPKELSEELVTSLLDKLDDEDSGIIRESITYGNIEKANLAIYKFENDPSGNDKYIIIVATKEDANLAEFEIPIIPLGDSNKKIAKRIIYSILKETRSK